MARTLNNLARGIDSLPPAHIGDIADQIQTGDLLFWKRRKSIISLAGRSIYSHVEIIVRDLHHLWAIGMVWPQGRMEFLVNLVEQYPGQLDWFRTDPKNIYNIDRDKIAEAALKSVGEPYGIGKLIYIIMLRIPILWRFISPVTDDGWRSPLLGKICSEGVSEWLRAGGVDPVPHLADSLTEPADLARSLLFEPAYSLII